MARLSLQSVCDEIFAGGDVPKGNYSIEKTDKYCVPIYSNGEKNDGLYGYTTTAKVTKPAVTVSARGTIGYTSIRYEQFVPVVRLITAIPKPDVIDIKYLFYALQKSSQLSSGTSIPQLTVPMIKEYTFNVPSINEQKTATVKLDILAGLISLRKLQLEKLDQLIKSQFIEMFGDPVTNPMGWEVKEVGEIAEIIKGITYSPEEVSNKGLIVLRSSNIKGNIFDLEDLVRINKNVDDIRLVKENDILMCNRNGSAKLVGKVAKIPKTSERMSFGTFMTIVRSSYFEYLFAFFQTDAFRRQIEYQTTVAINQISIPLLAGAKVPLPDFSLQDQFALFVQKVDKLKLEIQKSLEKLETLKKVLMQQYFG